MCGTVRFYLSWRFLALVIMAAWCWETTLILASYGCLYTQSFFGNLRKLFFLLILHQNREWLCFPQYIYRLGEPENKLLHFCQCCMMDDSIGMLIKLMKIYWVIRENSLISSFLMVKRIFLAKGFCFFYRNYETLKYGFNN